MKTSTQYTLGILLGLSFLATIWLGNYLFDHQSAAVAILTYAVLVFIHVFAVDILGRIEKRQAKTR